MIINNKDIFAINNMVKVVEHLPYSMDGNRRFYILLTNGNIHGFDSYWLHSKRLFESGSKLSGVKDFSQLQLKYKSVKKEDFIEFSSKCLERNKSRGYK